MDLGQYLDMFVDESKENLSAMNSVLLSLEKDRENIDLLNDIFRVAHTLKGMSGTMNFDKVAKLTHEMENVLDLLRNKEIKVNDIIFDILFECFDALENYISHLEEDGTEGDMDVSDLVKRLSYIHKNKTNILDFESDVVISNNDDKETLLEKISDDIILSYNEQGFDVFEILITLSKDCLIKTARVFVVKNSLADSCEIISTYPKEENIMDEMIGDVAQYFVATTKTREELLGLIGESSDFEKVNIQKHERTSSETTQKEVPIENKETKKEVKNPKKQSKTVRVDIERLDNLMNLVSELIIIKTSMDDFRQEAKSHNMNETIEYLERVTTNLHDAVMKVRMVPVERVFNRFPRMVRDLAKELGKDINLVMSGQDTEVDRTIIDEIADPLIHLIRNSLDHGIEMPDERTSIGKVSTGTVNLKAYPEGNSVIIEVSDDGGGIDPSKISKIALDKNLVDSGVLDSMSDTDKINMLFLPGFSTAKEVTDLSGRGVGLDVVKSKIENLGGTVDVKSTVGKGSVFTIRLPLTLAILQSLMVNIGSEKYALPLNNINEITIINAEKTSKMGDREVVIYRDRTLPLIRMREVIGLESDNVNNLVTVIVQKGDEMLGLVVDDLFGQQEIVIKSLGTYVKSLKSISGATIMGDGSVALIIDPTQLF